MSKDDHQRMDSLNELNYCEDYERNMSRTDCLPAEDSTGAALRKNILTGLAKTACTANPLEAWAATEAKNYNQRTPRKDYDWEAIAAKLGAPSTANNEQMAQTIACKQADLKPTIKDDKFTIDGKLGPKTISTLDLQPQTTEYVKKQKDRTKAEAGTKEIAKTITEPKQEQIANSINETANPNNEQIPYDLIKRMILDDLESNNRDNIGLLSLWIGTSQWGVSGIDSSIADPMDMSWKGPSAGKGKRMREYEQGGIGIADYDVGPLARFYQEFGTPDNKSMNTAEYVKKESSDEDKTKTYKYSSKYYDKIKSNHDFYEYCATLFDRGNGTKQNDEWNDEASIWLMEDWLTHNWHDSKVTQYHNIETQVVASRIKNSGNVSLDENDNVASLTKKYGDYGESREDRTREDYINRLQYTKRVSELHKHIKTDFDKGERVSENGASIITHIND